MTAILIAIAFWLLTGWLFIRLFRYSGEDD